MNLQSKTENINMPRLLSCYAKNKMAEEYLHKEQDKLHHEYSHVMRTHNNVTSELLQELVHIQIRTPSFQTKSASVASSVLPRHQTKTCSTRRSHNNPSSDMVSSKRLVLIQGKPAELHAREKATIVSLNVEVRDNKVYYQYNCPPRYWLKLVPNGRTQILLHRCNAVQRIMERFPQHPLMTSVVSVTENTPVGQGQILADVIDSKIDHVTRDEDEGNRRDNDNLPGKLDGLTIINWCLWNKEKTLPVWISQRAASVPAKRSRGVYFLPGPSKTTL